VADILAKAKGMDELRMKWTPEQIAFLTEYYPKKGKDWCVEKMGLTEAQIRQKASRLQLKARGVSEAWHAAVAAHGDKLRDRKRPEQAEVMKRLHAAGKLKVTEEGRKKRSEVTRAWQAIHGHPRGMLGKKHTDLTKQKVSEKSQEMWANMSEERRALKTIRMMKTRAEKGTYVSSKPHGSWRAAWREIGGKRKFYRSRWEANYARYLEFLKDSKHIKDWSHEPKTFWFEGVKRGCVSYLPDFCVTELDGTEAYHEVKGWMDARSKTKLKRMRKYHPDVKLIVIDKKAYTEIERKLGVVIPGWERPGEEYVEPQKETDELNFRGGWMREP
jgi:hypothetical protein